MGGKDNESLASSDSVVEDWLPTDDNRLEIFNNEVESDRKVVIMMEKIVAITANLRKRVNKTLLHQCYVRISLSKLYIDLDIICILIYKI